MRSLAAQVIDRLEEHVAHDRRLAAGRHVHALHLLDGALPVVAEPHLARRLLHLLLVPRELAVGERDELLGRVGNHLVGEIEHQSGPAARRARNAGVVGLARRVGLRDEIDARDLALARLLDEQIVDLGVPAQAVEIERLQRREPVEVGTGAGARHQGCWSRRARRGRRFVPRLEQQALHHGAHLVLRERDDLLQIGDLVELRRRCGRNRGRGCRGRCRNGVGRSDLVAQEGGVVLQRGVGLLVGHAHPPGEERIVVVVEVEPRGHAAAQAVDRVGPACRQGLADLQRVTCRASVQPGLDAGLHARDVPRQLGEHASRLLRVDILHTDAGLVQLDDRRGEGHERH